MKVKVTRMGAATYLAPQGPLVAENLAELEAGVQTARAGRAVDLVIDLTEVLLLDSRCLEYLLDLAGELREAGGTLRIAGPNPLCSDILAITRLDQMIPVFADREGAGGSFL